MLPHQQLRLNVDMALDEALKMIAKEVADTVRRIRASTGPSGNKRGSICGAW